MNNELYHHGILGQKWGIRRYQNEDGSLTSAGKKRYNPTSLSAMVARSANRKVDAGFEQWKDQDEKKKKAVELGKKLYDSEKRYNLDRTKENKKEYESIKKEYKQSLKDLTTYRKGAVTSEVKSYASRDSLKSAKKIRKMLDDNPNNKDLQRQYDRLMSEHEIYRYESRRSSEVATNRSRKIASIKRTMTMTVGAAATTAAVAIGAAYINKKSNYKFSTESSERFINIGRDIFDSIHKYF